MPYRVDIRAAGDAALDLLIELGALDVEPSPDGISALLPDGVTPERLAGRLGVDAITVSPAVGRDADSVWILKPRPIRIAGIRIIPADMAPEAGALRLVDAGAFGTGMHPTTALCLETLDELARAVPPDSALDIGTGSGVLALAALMIGVPQAAGIDIDGAALRVAAENARINGLSARLRLELGGPGTIAGTWPLVVANVLAAPLIDMAPAVVHRIARHGRLVLSGIPSSMEQEVVRAYCHLGMRHVGTRSRAGWVAVVLQAGW